jgi:uncharacterized membrane-anchored protein
MELVNMNETAEYALSKVPEVTLVFWIIKIAATTLGETGGDTVTMTLNWGYLAGTLLFVVALVALVSGFCSSKSPTTDMSVFVWAYQYRHEIQPHSCQCSVHRLSS